MEYEEWGVAELNCYKTRKINCISEGICAHEAEEWWADNTDRRMVYQDAADLDSVLAVLM